MDGKNVDVDQIVRVVEEIEGIVLLDLKGVQSTWKEHIDEIYRKAQEIRALCGASDY